jgi:transposase-like protein
MDLLTEAFLNSELQKVAATATKTDPAKWEQAKRDAKARMGGKHSARAMQLAVQLYKKRGGGYSGAKPTSKSNSLKKWTKQKWQYSGKDTPGQGGKGVYLPKKKIERLKSTDKGKAKLRSAEAKKREATREGRQYSRHGLAAGTSLKKKASQNVSINKPIAMMTHPELTRERNRLVKQYYGWSRKKNYAVGGVSGAVMGAAVSKAVLKRGTIPAAAVSGIVGATAVDSYRKKQLLKRIRKLSIAMRKTSTPVRYAKKVS